VWYQLAARQQAARLYWYPCPRSTRQMVRQSRLWYQTRPMRRALSRYPAGRPRFYGYRRGRQKINRGKAPAKRQIIFSYQEL